MEYWKLSLLHYSITPTLHNSGLLFVVHPSLRKLQLQQRQREHCKEKEPSERAGVAHFQETERVIKQMIGVKECRIDRAALGHDERLGEDL
jgi:hypothetical protein